MIKFLTAEVEWMEAEDPLFMLYTSGSTGVPKGVLHSCAGYMLYAATTFKYSFDFQENDVYWCTADVGWITGKLFSNIYICSASQTTRYIQGMTTLSVNI